MQINFRIRGVEAVQSFLRAIPRGAVRVALQAFSEYVVGNEQHGLRHAEPYKYASRARAYGYTGAKFENGNPVPAGYFSAKQFRYVMAKIASGEMTPGTENRTGKSTAAWQAVPRNDGYRYTLSNGERGAYYTRDDKGQARQPANVGWRKVSQVVTDNYLGGIRSAVAAVKKFLASKKG
jgi:hypothetical protein